MNVYTRDNGKLAKWDVETDCHMVAIHSVRTFAEVGPKIPVLAVIDGCNAKQQQDQQTAVIYLTRLFPDFPVLDFKAR